MLEFVILTHGALVLFNTSAFFFIIMGMLYGWRWTRGRLFRFAHLFLIAFVAFQAVTGAVCPLTSIEERLRFPHNLPAIKQGFIARLVEALIYYDLPDWVFTCLYMGAFFLAVLLFIVCPPEKSKRTLK